MMIIFDYKIDCNLKTTRQILLNFTAIFIVVGSGVTMARWSRSTKLIYVGPG